MGKREGVREGERECVKCVFVRVRETKRERERERERKAIESAG